MSQPSLGNGEAERDFYGRDFCLANFDELLEAALELPSGRGELALGRIGLLGIVYESRQPGPSDERIRRYERLIDKSDMVMGMMLKLRTLSGEAADGLLGAIGQALDEVSGLVGG
jgi:hypothetical protein